MKAHRFWVLASVVLFETTACTSLIGDDFVVGAKAVNCTVDPNACVNEHASNACVAGTCTPACDPGFGNCDANGPNGCETDLSSDTNHCGTCNQRCVASHATAVCRASSCEVAACDPGWEDCNRDPLDGCEQNVATDKNHCGACGVLCENAQGSTACVKSECIPTCGAGFADCDNNPANGCETDTESSTAHCGRCTNAVAQDHVCSGGVPVLASLCPATNRDCNGNLTIDGCEVNVQIDNRHCGACDIACGAGTFCRAASCKSCTFLKEDFATTTSGWTVEGQWEVGSAKAGGGGPCTVPLLQCGPPDPGVDHTSTADNGVAGVALGGNYSTSSPGPFYLTSPSLDLRGSGSVRLEFWRWLNSDQDPYIVNSVEAFDGAAWRSIWASPKGTTMQFLASEWTKLEYDLTPFKSMDDAMNGAFRVRFGFAVGRPDGYFLAGWNIDDVVIESTNCGQ